MGGLYQIDNKLVAWTGGEPDASWTAFNAPIPSHRSPNQLRTTNDVKGYNLRKKGLDIKFNRTDSLMPFKKLVQVHMKDCGLDTVGYLPDKQGKMSSVITDHARFTLEAAQKQASCS